MGPDTDRVRRHTALPLFVGGAVLTHALTGRYPLLPLLRRAGVRSAREIGRERYALKALRGDFANLEASGLAAERSVTSDAAAAAFTHREGRP
jgi:hypothetical protein